MPGRRAPMRIRSIHLALAPAVAVLVAACGGLAAAPASAAVSSSAAAAAASTADVHDLTVVLADPTGVATDYTRADALHALSVVDTFYSHESSGALRFRVTSATEWTEGGADLHCDDLDSVIAFGTRVAGFVPGRNRDLLVMTPGGAGCVYAVGQQTGDLHEGGSATVSTIDPTTIAHELGHTLALHHTSAVRCASSWDPPIAASLPASCTRDEYGDTSDIMGGGFTLYPFSPVSLSRLGILRNEVVPACGATRRISIATMSASPSAQRVIGWVDPAHPGIAYSVQFRDVVDNTEYSTLYPSPAAGDDDQPTGVQVHRTDPVDPAASSVLTRPGDSSRGAQRIRAGEKVPLDDGMSVSVVAIDGTAHTATVDVTIPCAAAAQAGAGHPEDATTAPAATAVVADDER